MDGAEVGVLEERDEVGLRGLLQSHNSMALEADIGEELPGDLLHKPLEGKLADAKLGRPLVLADLTKSLGARTEAVRLLEATRPHTASSSFGQLLARS